MLSSSMLTSQVLSSLKDLSMNFLRNISRSGVAEQNMAGIATGMAHAGKIPFITSFAAFSPGLNFSQIRLASMSHLPLKIVGSHYGLNVGPDGASAQMESDIAMMRALPGVPVFFSRL